MTLKEIITIRKAFINIVLPYAIFSALWILLSDLFLSALPLAEDVFTRLSILKGWIFVLVTSLLLFFLLRREINTIKKIEASLLEKEKFLRESEMKYRLLFESSGDAILLMDNDKFIECNDMTLKMFGCDREDIIGGTPYEFSPSNQPDGRSSEEKAKEKINLVITEGPQKFEWIHCRKDGTPFLCEVTLNSIMVNGYLILQAIVRDITERKKAEELIRESERKYREVVENAPCVILQWTPEGIITFMSKYGLKLFGYTEAELIGHHVVGTIVPEVESTGRDLKTMIDNICANPHAFELNINENICKSGRRVWIQWINKALFDEDGKLREILSIGSDITEILIAKKEIEKLNQELKRYTENLEQLVKDRTAELAEAMEKAQSADRLKSAFLATMSHELRTPLNSIIGFTGILLQGLAGPLNEEQQKQLKMVQNSARHLLSLINDILDISKIEAGQVTLAPTSFELRDSIEKVVKMVKPLADKKGLELKIRLSDDIDIITTDQRRFEQIVLNLLSNSIKFTENGWIELSCFRDKDYYVLAVKDTGIGISPDEIPNIFKPFHQIEKGLTRKYEGTGLGLSICKKLVDMMGGLIDVSSELGKGSTFTVTLPRKGDQR